MAYWDYYKPYESVAQKKARAKKKLQQLRKKNPNIQPIEIEGRALVKTWWGKSWNKNLESYADYDTRLGRGRSYVRNSAVLDLQIEPGKIKSLVQGSASSPYKVEITINTLKEKKWQDIKNTCQGQLESVQELLAGKLPKTMAESFTTQKTGLFPSPSEISFHCSCPDWADMCKHIAATLYGIGSRLDQQPDVFFTLRKVDIEELVSKAIDASRQNLLKKAKVKSSRVIADKDLSTLFNIDVEAIDLFIKRIEKKGKAAKNKKTSRGNKKKKQTKTKKKQTKTK